MASIPLPALHTAPIQQPQSPLETMAQLMGIKNAQQEQAQRQAMAPLQQQQAQQQVQSGQLELQQQQQQMKDQQAMTSAMQQWDGKDYNDIIPLVTKNGGSAQAVMGLKQKVLAQQQAVSTTLKNNADAGQAQMAALKTKGDLLDGALTPLIDPKQTPDAQLPDAVMSTAQDLLNRGILDPQHMTRVMQLAQSGDPTQIRQQIDLMRKTNMAQSQVMEDATKQIGIQTDLLNQKKLAGSMDPNSPLYAPSEDAVAMGTAPGAAQIQAGKVKAAAATAAAQENARMPGEMALAKQKQVLSQGDPNAAGQLLVNGDATLSELKARGATPEFIQQTLNAAHGLSGGKYNAQSADAQFQVAKSPANVAFFGSANSLTDPGGTLDQLAAAAKDLPGGHMPAFNKIADWEKAQTGSGPIAKYAALALGVADDYSKVMGGGNGSDSSRMSALNLVGASQSPEQRAASIQGIRGAVNSQKNSRIGQNGIMKRMYGDAAPVQPSGATSGPSGSQAGISVTAPNGFFGKFGGTVHP